MNQLLNKKPIKKSLKIIEGLSLYVTKGQAIGITGPSGSGKTTLLRGIVGAIKPSSGHINKRVGLHIGYVPQRLHIDTTLPLTVRRFLSLPSRVSYLFVEEALTAAGVGDLASQQMVVLSGGQFQRVLLARALIGRPELLLLDEATQGLDQPGSAAFYRQIETVRQNLDCAVLMVSRDVFL